MVEFVARLIILLMFLMMIFVSLVSIIYDVESIEFRSPVVIKSWEEVKDVVNR